MDKQEIRAELLNRDIFMLWLIDELDSIESQLEKEFSALKYVELKARHQALIDVRDAYVERNKQKSASQKMKKVLVEGE